MKYWRVKYIDKYSGGKVSTTVYHGDITKEEVIKFFGLENEDVYWYDCELIEK